MVSLAVRAALERLWTDRCTVIVQEETTDPVSHITKFGDKVLYKEQPCKLSFETSPVSGGEPAASTVQVVKLFLPLEFKIPAGSKIMVTRPGVEDYTASYSRSGAPGVFHNHQEIMLEPFRGWV